MEMNKYIKSGFLLVGLCSANIGLAQEAGNGFSAVINGELRYDDNILRQSDNNKKSGASLLVAPELTFAGGFGKQLFRAIYKGEYSNYFNNSDVNYNDHDLVLRADLDHSHRLNSRFIVQRRYFHEEVGNVNLVFNDLTEFNRVEQSTYRGEVAYGRNNSLGRVSLELRHDEAEYTNNEQEGRDNDRNSAFLRFFYRIAPRTRLLAEASYTDIDYVSSNRVELDSKYKRYQVGVEWSLTEQLEGNVKVGYQDRDYRLAELNDIDGLAYSVDLTWLPNTYSEVILEARRESVDSAAIDTSGGFVRDSVAVSASHGITERLTLEGLIGYKNDDLVFASGDPERTDKHYDFHFATVYSLLTYIDVGLEYRREQRNSTLRAAEYTSNSINLTLTVALD